MAAIVAVHAEAPSWGATDWREIVGLYDLLVAVWPSPVVALNRAVAIGFAEGPDAGLAALSQLGDDPLIVTYLYLASSRADFLRRLDRHEEARLAYRKPCCSPTTKPSATSSPAASRSSKTAQPANDVGTALTRSRPAGLNPAAARRSDRPGSLSVLDRER